MVVAGGIVAAVGILVARDLKPGKFESEYRRM